jgi:hypothetical protein
MKRQKYFCPMHPEVTSEKAGNCPKCGMRLVNEGASGSINHESSEKIENSYWPLVIIIGFISLVTFVLTTKDYVNGAFNLDYSMSYFMAGFFLTFSAFKFLDLKGFAEGYSSYDLLAQKAYQYGFIYPFLELGLGLAYLFQINDYRLHVFTLILMGFSGLGVLNSMLKKRKFQCACLGTFLKVPLTKVTLIEDFGMAVMAFLMLVA